MEGLGKYRMKMLNLWEAGGGAENTHLVWEAFENA